MNDIFFFKLLILWNFSPNQTNLINFVTIQKLIQNSEPLLSVRDKFYLIEH